MQYACTEGLHFSAFHLEGSHSLCISERPSFSVDRNDCFSISLKRSTSPFGDMFDTELCANSSAVN